MKKLFTIIALFTLAVWASAQTIYLCKGGDYTAADIREGLEIDLTANYDSITFEKPQMAPVVSIVYYGHSVQVGVPSFLEGVTCSIDGADLTVTSTNTTDEVTYMVFGKSDNGSLTINGQYKMTMVLNDLELTSTRGAAIDIQCGKRTNIVLPKGTTTTLCDAATGSQKACLYSKGHVEVSGGGTLNVTGNKSHAISTKEYFQMKRTAGTLNIVASANDGIHAGQYFLMNGGTVNITGATANDGIQAEVTNDATDEHNGEVIINGGVLNITAAGMDAKAIKADSDISINGGRFNIAASGNGSRGIQTAANLTIGETEGTTDILVNATGTKCTNPECASDPHNCMGIKVDGNMTVNAGTLTVYNTGKKSKAIKVAGTYTRNGGSVNIKDEDIAH